MSSPARATVRLYFPLDLPGGRIDTVHLNLDRPGAWHGERAIIERITGLSASILDRLAESDYVRILLKIEELNNPRLRPQAVV